MPIYEFRCKNCKKVFEVLFRSSDEILKVCCPGCRSEKTEKLLSVFGSRVEKGTPSSDVPPCAATCKEFS
jgi:putative FmdB family regulatory protein